MTYFVERSFYLIEEHWLLIITGVQASGVIFNGQSLKLPDECGPAISDHKNSTVAINDQWFAPEAWTPVIIKYIFTNISDSLCTDPPSPQ